MARHLSQLQQMDSQIAASCQQKPSERGPLSQTNTLQEETDPGKIGKQSQTTMKEKQARLGPFPMHPNGRQWGMYPRLKTLRPQSQSLAPATPPGPSTSTSSNSLAWLESPHGISPSTTVSDTEAYPFDAILYSPPAPAFATSCMGKRPHSSPGKLHHSFDYKWPPSSSQSVVYQATSSPLQSNAASSSSSICSGCIVEDSGVMRRPSCGATEYSVISALDLSVPPALHRGPLNSNPPPSIKSACDVETSTPPPIIRVRKSNPVLKLCQDLNPNPECKLKGRTATMAMHRRHSSINCTSTPKPERNRLRKAPPQFRPSTSLSHVSHLAPAPLSSGSTPKPTQQIHHHGTRSSLSRVLDRLFAINKPRESLSKPNIFPLKRVSLHPQLASSRFFSEESTKRARSDLHQNEGQTRRQKTIVVPYTSGLKEWDDEVDQELHNEEDIFVENLGGFGMVDTANCGSRELNIRNGADEKSNLQREKDGFFEGLQKLKILVGPKSRKQKCRNCTTGNKTNAIASKMLSTRVPTRAQGPI